MGFFLDLFQRWRTRLGSEGSHLQQSCAIPYRRSESGFEFCLITSIRSGRWGFPKGLIDPGETPEQTALKESHEEAGISGRIMNPPHGSYTDRKWGRSLHVTVYLMEVTHAEVLWLESHVRQRRFCSVSEAHALLKKSRQHKFFKRALQRLAIPGSS